MRRLKADGHTLEVLDKVVDGLKDVRQVDIADLSKVKEILGSFKPELVVHLAALAGSTGKGGGAESLKSPYQYFNVNFNTALSIYESCRQLGILRVLCMSSFSPYGPTSSPINEDTPFNPNNPYGGSKACVEEIAKVYSANYGIKTVILRPPLICGEGQMEMNALREFVTSALAGTPIKILGEGTHVREFVHPSDVADAFSAAIFYLQSMTVSCEPFVLGSRPIRMIDLANLVVQKVGKGSIVFEPASSQTFDQFTDHSKAKRLLGWEPKVGVDEIVTRVIDDIKFRQLRQGVDTTVGTSQLRSAGVQQ